MKRLLRLGKLLISYVVTLPFFFLLCLIELLGLKSLLVYEVRLYNKWLCRMKVEGIVK